MGRKGRKWFIEREAYILPMTHWLFVKLPSWIPTLFNLEGSNLNSLFLQYLFWKFLLSYCCLYACFFVVVFLRGEVCCFFIFYFFFVCLLCMQKLNFTVKLLLLFFWRTHFCNLTVGNTVEGFLTYLGIRST